MGLTLAELDPILKKSKPNEEDKIKLITALTQELRNRPVLPKKNLEILKNYFNKSETAIVKDALDLYVLLVKYQSQGHQIKLTKNGSKLILEFVIDKHK